MKGTKPKAVIMGQLLMAALADATQGNVEPFRRYFTAPTFDARTGKLMVKSIRKTQGAVTNRPEQYELVSWEFTMQAKQLSSKRITKAEAMADDGS